MADRSWQDYLSKLQILKDGSIQQRYLCRDCRKRFNDRTNAPMARLRTSPEVVAAALNVRSEGLGCTGNRSFIRKVSLHHH